MVDAELAGVLFTVEPVSQNRSILVGNFVHGLGEQLVSGEVNAESFTIERASLSYEGPEDLSATATQLAELALQIETQFDSPQDIE